MEHQTAKLNIIRQNSMIGIDRDMDVIFDGQVVASIKEAEPFELNVVPGAHTIRFRLKRRIWGRVTPGNMSGTSTPFAFQIAAGETKTIKIKPKGLYILYHVLAFIVAVLVLFWSPLDKTATYIIAAILIGVPVILLDRSLLHVSVED